MTISILSNDVYNMIRHVVYKKGKKSCFIIRLCFNYILFGNFLNILILTLTKKAGKGTEGTATVVWGNTKFMAFKGHLQFHPCLTTSGGHSNFLSISQGCV